MITIIDKDELYSLIKKAVREVIKEEKLDIFLGSLAPTTVEEMNDIERQYGKPSSQKDIVRSDSLELWTGGRVHGDPGVRADDVDIKIATYHGAIPKTLRYRTKRFNRFVANHTRRIHPLQRRNP